MKTYQAVLTGGRVEEIPGTFPDANAARVWALQQWGGGLADVIEIPTFAIDHAELDPAWLVLGAVGLLLLLANDKRKKRKRGRVVSSRR